MRRCNSHEALFVLSYSVNLMNVSSAVAKRSSFSFAAGAQHLLAPDEGQQPVKQRDKLLFSNCKFRRNPRVTKTKSNISDAMLWHCRLGHINVQDFSSDVNVAEVTFCEMITASEIYEAVVPMKMDSTASAMGN